MEFLGIAPKGSTGIHTFLLKARDSLAIGGELGIFTPMVHWFFVLFLTFFSTLFWPANLLRTSLPLTGNKCILLTLLLTFALGINLTLVLQVDITTECDAQSPPGSCCWLSMY